MNSRLQNQLNMVGASITVANSDTNKSVWKNQPPADFTIDMAKLEAGYGEASADAAKADAATGGAADVKAAAETVLEDSAYILVRAMANHFKKNGDLDNLAKVDVTKSEIVKLRTQDLLDKTTAWRDLAIPTSAEPNAADRGVTAARIATLSAAITGFAAVMNTPRGQIVNRSTLLREVETDVAALIEQVTDMDDLAMQFDTTDAGLRFIEAWKRARMIVDSGQGHATPAPVPAPVAPPTP